MTFEFTYWLSLSLIAVGSFGFGHYWGLLRGLRVGLEGDDENGDD